MTDHEPDDAEQALRAIGHPGRRTMLRLAWETERTSSELAEGAGLSKSATSQHLKLLKDAGLMHVTVDGNRRLYRVDVERMAELRAFLDDFWGDRLTQLKARAETRGRAHRRQRGSA